MSLVHGSSIPKDNLALYLDPGNIKSYPGSGSTWYDLSGNGNHATLYASPIFHDNYVTWNGSTQYASVTANQETLNFMFGQTIIIWLKYFHSEARVNPYHQSWGGYGNWVHEPSDTLQYYYYSSPYNPGNLSMYFDKWTMFTSTRDLTNVKWYANGKQISSVAHGKTVNENSITTDPLLFGRGSHGYWGGDMAAAILYTRALSADEIAEIYHSSKNRYQS